MRASAAPGSLGRPMSTFAVGSLTVATTRPLGRGRRPLHGAPYLGAPWRVRLHLPFPEPARLRPDARTPTRDPPTGEPVGSARLVTVQDPLPGRGVQLVQRPPRRGQAGGLLPAGGERQP